MATLDDIKLLAAEFPREDISWRAQSVTKNGEKAMALAYIDARNVMERLDSIVGPIDWQDRYEFHGTRTICYLSIRVDNEWITKADGAGDTDVEGEKGAISDALKRAAVKWGIGRYLYEMPAPWVPCESYEATRNGKPAMVWKAWRVDPWTMVKKAPGINIKTGRTASHALKKTPVWETFQQELLECETVTKLTNFALAWSTKAEKENWPDEWRESARDEINKRKQVIINGPSAQTDLDPGYVNILDAG